MTRIISTIVLVLAVILFPPATLAFVSQNAVPGDKTYPIKRKLEDIILAIASVNPHTKALFEVNLSNTRFDESKVLLTKGESAADALNELVVTTNQAADQISQISDPAQKQQLATQLSASINKYEQELTQVKTQITVQTTEVNPSSAPIARIQSNSQVPSNPQTYSNPSMVPVSPGTNTPQTSGPQTTAVVSNSGRPTPAVSQTQPSSSLPQSSSPGVPPATSAVNSTTPASGNQQNIDQTINQLQQIQNQLNSSEQPGNQNSSQGINNGNQGNNNGSHGNGDNGNNSNSGDNSHGDNSKASH